LCSYDYVPTPIGFKTSRWAQDTFARGSYSTLWVGSTDKEWYDLARPESESLYFAGEHTNYDGRYQSIDGAYNTGAREAERIAARPYNAQSGVEQSSTWMNPNAFSTGWSPSELAETDGGSSVGEFMHGAETLVDADGSLYKTDRETRLGLNGN